MQRKHRLKANASFRYIYRKGESTGNKNLVLLSVTAKGVYKAGLSVGKKVGGAVVRNHVKRLLRESFISLGPQIKDGYHFIVIAKENAANLSFIEMKQSLADLLTRQNKLKA